MILNKVEYPEIGDTSIVEVPHSEYYNLKIYPYLGILETYIGILTDIGGNYRVYGKNTIDNCVIRNYLNYQAGHDIVGYVDTVADIPKNLENVLVLLSDADKSLDTHFKNKVKILQKNLYFNFSYDIFKKLFGYYYRDLEFNYSNLICYCMIVKNAGPLLEQVLTENLSIIDRWCILDTGSTDGTQDTIRRVLSCKKGNLYEEPFVNFKVSRNRCLELAGKTCKFIIMLDDTYTVRGDLRGFLEEVRGDQFSDSFSLLIQSNDSEYYSNRIIKSETELRYMHTIHEVISDKNNINVTIPSSRSYIFDHRADYMEKRTIGRKQLDLELLFKEYSDNPDDPRPLYYIAQTYGCLNDDILKAKYFELRIAHPVQGYVQEKIDSFFELARTYNFSTHPFGVSWERCEELYLEAYSLDPTRPDSLYFIGIHYYLEKNYEVAYTYFKKGFEIGYPVNSQYSLKPTLSYHFLPKFLTEICYYLGDSVTGENAARLFLTSSKFNTPETDSWNLMNSWYNIHFQLNRMGPINPNPAKHPKKIFCIVANSPWGNWTGSDILTKGVGGSETWVIEIASCIQSSEFDVVVFCKCDSSSFHNGVGYNPIGVFNEFIANNIVDYCMISRYTEYIPVALAGHAQQVGVIFHDTLPSEMIIPEHPKLKQLIGLTEWHSKMISQTFPQFKVHSLNYGIDQTKFFPGKKIKNSFIYSSFPNRGLLVLLKMWPRILEIFPDAVLNVYSDLNGEWVNKVAPEQMKTIKELLPALPGVTVHSWVSKSDLSIAFQTADYWLYPCIFAETFCLTALEAAISKTFVISNNLAALEETVGNRGLIVHGDPLTKEWQDSVIESLKTHSADFKRLKIIDNYFWALTHSWKAQSQKLFDEIINVSR